MPSEPNTLTGAREVLKDGFERILMAFEGSLKGMVWASRRSGKHRSMFEGGDGGRVRKKMNEKRKRWMLKSLSEVGGLFEEE